MKSIVLKDQISIVLKTNWWLSMEEGANEATRQEGNDPFETPLNVYQWKSKLDTKMLKCLHLHQYQAGW